MTRYPRLLRFGVSISSVHQALRDATADVHRALEADAGVEARLRDAGERPGMVARFHALHQAVEQAVAPWRAAAEESGYAPMDRAPMIRDDLQRLATPTASVADMPALGTFGEALGWLYVAEGSMLGGRVMRRAMAADGVPLAGLDFLDPHGADTGARWRAFLQALEAACASGRALPADVVRGGRDAFDLASRLLVPSRCPERFQ